MIALPLIVLGGLSLALVAWLLPRWMGPKGLWALAVFPAAAFGAFVGSPSGEWSHTLVRSLGMDLALRLDGLGRAFALLITGLATLILIFAGATFKAKDRVGPFASAFTGFTAAMLGLVLADDLIALFLFWELTSVCSFVLIGFYHHEETSRKNAAQALLLTGLGGLALLAGLLLLTQATGVQRLSQLPPLAGDHPLSLAAFVLIALGCFTKSAQFPFHFWLPNAMVAPTPVSAFLHSATMVKAGVLVLARLQPSLEGLPYWGPTLTLFGGLTVATALVLMFFHRDLKALLAYSTLGMLGMLTALLGQPTEYAAKAFVGLCFAHALYKGGLFLVAGGLEKVTHTRDPLAISGLHQRCPKLAFAAALLSLSSFGLVGFLGFPGKEYAILAANTPGFGLIVVLFALGAGLVAMRVGVLPFWGADLSHPEAQEAPAPVWLGPMALGLCGLVFGVGVSALGPALLNPMAAGLHPSSSDWTWKVFPGFNLPLFLGIALAIAAAVLGWRWGPTKAPESWSLSHWWHKSAALLPAWCEWPTRAIQNGRLRDYFALYFALVSGISIWGIVRFGLNPVTAPLPAPQLHEWVLALMAIVATISVVFIPRRIAAICVLGVVGTAIGVLFLNFGAPDLALTQILVELLTIVLAVLVFQKLPKFRRLSDGWTRVRDGVIAATFGVSMTMLVLAVQNTEPTRAAAAFYAERSVPEAFGRNVVNTILVDFRALDTLGEITVVVLAALGVFAMMHLRAQKVEE